MSFIIIRAALKMANIDATFNFMFTDPKYLNKKYSNWEESGR